MATTETPNTSSAKRIDLNLLAVFDMVMTERHVSRAAERLDMTQSAVSNALNRLRQRFQDRLFVKVAKGVEPTPKALSLWPTVHTALEELRTTIEPRTFDPEHDARLFRIAMVDITVSLLAPHLYATVQPQSPLTSFFFVPHGPAETAACLMRGDLDFAVGIEPPRASVIQTTRLWSDSFVVAARKGHPLMKRPISLERLCTTPHIAINEPGDLEATNVVDRALADRGRHRHIGMSVNQFVVVPAILQMSDMITVIPARFATAPSLSHLIACRPVPFDIPSVTIYLSWHQRNNTSTPHTWMRHCILEAAAAVNKQFQNAS